VTRGTAPRGARPPGLIATALCAALAVFGRAAFAQSPAAETTAPEAPPAVGAQQPFPLLFGLFDLSAAYTFPAKVIGGAGRMSSTFLTGRLAPVIRLNPRLYLSFPLDGSVSFYQFEGDPGLLPAGGSPWDQVRSFAVGAQARYRVDEILVPRVLPRSPSGGRVHAVPIGQHPASVRTRVEERRRP
jgi:hypothetical protein